jgi:hypothetical protein
LLSPRAGPLRATHRGRAVSSRCSPPGARMAKALEPKRHHVDDEALRAEARRLLGARAVGIKEPHRSRPDPVLRAGAAASANATLKPVNFMIATRLENRAS